MADTKHSHIGASSAHRWTVCTGSPRMIEKAPKADSSIYAEEGTAAHEVGSQALVTSSVLKKFIDPETYIGEVFNNVEVTQEMVDAVRVYLEKVHELRTQNPGGHEFIEAGFDLERLFSGMFGTADYALVDKDLKRLHVVDYKHGVGIVNVEQNPQLLYYALGVIMELFNHKLLDDPLVFGWDQIEEVVIHVVQPRARHSDGPVRSWVVPKGYLDTFAAWLVEQAQKTTDPKAPLVAGDHCKFCPAMVICSAFGKKMTDLAVKDFDDLPVRATPILPPPESMSMDQMLKVLKHADLFASWLKAVEKHAFYLANTGQKIPGYKLVKKKSNRRWKDPGQAADSLLLLLSEDKIYEKTVISIAAAEKLVGKKNFAILETLIEKPDTGNTLAEEHDPREEVKPDLVTDFNDEIF